jgi:HK97 family phage prohead protease
MTLTPTPTLIRKTAPIQIENVDDAKGIVTAYVNTLDVVDFDDEVIASGAFDQSIAKGLPAIAWMHDQRTIVGGVTAAQEKGKRLSATMQFDLDTEPGAYAFKMVARGRVKEWSVGFYADQWHVEQRSGRDVRIIEAVDWVEVSPVLRGASPGTATAGIKQTPPPDDPNPDQNPNPGPDSPASAVPATPTATRAAGTDTPTVEYQVEATAMIAAYRDQLAQLGFDEPEVKAGRTMSARNLDQLHGAMTGLAALHLSTCDLGDGCPITTADTGADD